MGVIRRTSAEGLDSSSEFLSLRSLRSNRRVLEENGSNGGSAVTPRALRAARRSQEECEPDTRRTNGCMSIRDEEDFGRHYLRSRRPLVEKQNVSTDSNDKSLAMSKQESLEPKQFTRKSARLQAGAQNGVATKEAPPIEPSSSAAVKDRQPEEEGDNNVRRSCRVRRYRYNTLNQSVLYDRLITNTAEAVLQKMDDMKKMRRRMKNFDNLHDTEEEENIDLYSERKRKRGAVTMDEETTDNQDEDGNGEFSGDDQEDEEDNQKRYDFRKRKAMVRYQAPLDEPRKQNIFYRGHTSPARRRYRFRTNAPQSSYCNGRKNRRRHAVHSSDSTSSSESDDEQYERRRSRKRIQNGCLPLNFRKDDLLGIHKDRMKIGSSLADVDPMSIDKTVTFDSIGGLKSHIALLKEMVLLPLLYPEVFERLKVSPPRGCLFYGPPGTGKTLLARVLCNECSQGGQKVSFFMRKGADCLSKWVGESERQLRLLFDQAYKMRPSIIFFDEIDGLAPVRSSKQDQIHSSIVSTLLALMDGLDNRGEVIVIGATNRLDAIDPALRRPGRFDREFLFDLPDREARKEIFKVHASHFHPKPCDALLEELAEKSVGYCGADIKAACTEAALCALRRRYPQIYSTSAKLQLNVESIVVSPRDFATAMRKIIPASQRSVNSPAEALSPIMKPLLENTLQEIMEALKQVFPHAEERLKRKQPKDIASFVLEEAMMYSDDNQAVTENTSCPGETQQVAVLDLNRHVFYQPTSFRPRLLLAGDSGSGQSAHLGPAVLHVLEAFPSYSLDIAYLYGTSTTTPEEACTQVLREAKRTAPSIVYIPRIQRWWETVGLSLKEIFLVLLQSIPSYTPVFLLATCDLPYEQLPTEIQDMFRSHYGEVFHITVPNDNERRKFFEELILNRAAKPPVLKKAMPVLEDLPVVPPQPRQLTPEEVIQLEKEEEDKLRELRIFLRDVTNKLAVDKRFRVFTKPVTPEEVPDYNTVIKEPMDLSTILSKIDSHKYMTVKEYLCDMDLICANALEYNPDKDPTDRLIRHRACMLKDTVHAIIREELDEDFEKLCEEIKESREKRGCSAAKFAPSYYHVQPKQTLAAEGKKTSDASKAIVYTLPTASSTPANPAVVATKKKRKSRRYLWRAGFYKKKKLFHNVQENVTAAEEEEEEEEEEETGADTEDAEDRLDSLSQSSLSQVENETGGDLSLDCTSAQSETSAEGPQGVLQNGEISEDANKVLTRQGRPHALAAKLHHPSEAVTVKASSGSSDTLTVDHQKLQDLLEKLSVKARSCTVLELERLHAVVAQCVFRHRKEDNKAALIQEIEAKIETFRSMDQ
ncbi:ATPase family AAA domain-containing protein 2-like [Erpetoichthys calabaricus]|uniref:ATPase family AAA domain-containing protein 2-like n=1 Tax=Erpetoichthys calabaricus TaxID=27687 RepID=UPI002234CD1F|nr:ATPase family AAA domain-containing protein 2-like [Erpetoichthys calabaricus]